MKKLIAAILACISVSVANIALAEPVKITGEASIKYDRDAAAGDPTTAGTMYTLKLKGEKGLGAGWSLYARLGGEYATRPALANFNGDEYGTERKSAMAVDQFGVTRKSGQLVFNLGRQDVNLGLEGLLYSRKDERIGKRVFVDGLTVTGTSGQTGITAVIAQEDNPGSQDNKLYYIRAGYNAGERMNWGLTLGRYQNTGAESTNHWAVDGTCKFGKSSLAAQFTKSSSGTDNRAYMTSWNYDLDGKAGIYIIGFRVEANGDIGGQSDFANGNKGVHYGLTYKLSDPASIEIVYKDRRVIAGGRKNSELEATLRYGF